MKLSQIYSNNHRIFPPIEFNGIADNQPSAIFARVKKPKDAKKDSHNLGKTLLVDLIDFLLLKDINPTPHHVHFLHKHSLLFADWFFYLELQTTTGKFVTIRRSVKEPTKIAFKSHLKRLGNIATNGAMHTGWDHTDVALERAVQLLDGYLGLESIKPFTYRSGVGYFLRTQADYRQLFQLDKTAAGADKTWKPYLAKVFGLDPQRIMQKYVLDEEVADLKAKVDEIQQSIPRTRTKNLNELRMEVSTRQQVLGETEGRIDRFKFAQEEIRISKELAEDLESEDADLNARLTNLDYDIAQMRTAMQREVIFDPDHIKKIFDEAKVYFAPQLAKDYRELVQFNRTITTERSKFLRKQIKDLEKERNELTRKKGDIDDRRAKCYEILQEHDTFRKFKSLQKEQVNQRADLEHKVQQIRRLEELLEAEKNHRAKMQERARLVEEIEAEVNAGTEIQRRINNEFARMVHKVLNLRGSVYLRTNASGNIEPEHTADPAAVDAGTSSQSDGSTYKRFLCILFDLAVLKAYSKESFFRFVYHDGILETMDDRKKVEMLHLLHEFSAETGVQCIFSVIESEMPVGPDGKRMELAADEIVRELSDVGANGRLFRMASF